MAEPSTGPSSGNESTNAGAKGGADGGNVRVYERPAGADRSPILKVLPILIALIVLAVAAWLFLRSRTPAPADNRPGATQPGRDYSGSGNPPGPGRAAPSGGATAPSGGTANPPGPAGR